MNFANFLNSLKNTVTESVKNTVTSLINDSPFVENPENNKKIENIIVNHAKKIIKDKVDVVKDKAMRYALSKYDDLRDNPHRQEIIDLIQNDFDISFDVNENRDNFDDLVKKFDLIERLPITHAIYIKIEFVDNDGVSQFMTLVYNKANAKRIKTIMNTGDFEEIGDSIYASLYEEAAAHVPHFEKRLVRIIFSNHVVSGSNRFTPFYETNEGGFFPFILSPEWYEFKEILRKYQILSSLEDPIIRVNCFVYSLQMSGLVDDVKIESIKSRCLARNISRKTINEIGQLHGLKFIIKKMNWNNNKMENINRKKAVVIGAPDGVEIKLGLIAKHYFLLERINGITAYYINNKKTVNGFYENSKRPWKVIDQMKIKRYRNDRNVYEKLTLKEQEERGISSMKLIKLLIENDAFIPITYDDLAVLTSEIHVNVEEEYKTLNYMDHDNITYGSIQKKKLINVAQYEKDTQEINEGIAKRIFYADFEAVTNEKIHRAYCVSIVHKYTDNKKLFYGFDCVEKFFECIPEYSIVYFHNLKYDGCFLREYLEKACVKGNNYYSMECNYNGKRIFLKDSSKIITMPLSAFSSTFNLSSLKEIFPYALYTENTIKQGKYKIDEADMFEKIKWNSKEKQLFKDNVKRIGAELPDGYFDLEKYVSFYCDQDTNLLKQGMLSFGNDLKEALKIDVDCFLTISSISQNYFTEKLYKSKDIMDNKNKKDKYSHINNIVESNKWNEKQKNIFLRNCINSNCIKDHIVNLEIYRATYGNKIYMNGGVIKSYLSQFTYGGRCMLSENIKQICTEEELVDQDNNSLYPAAYSKLYVVEGKPQIITDFNWVLKHMMPIKQIEQTEDKFISAFTCRIKITKVGKYLNFPLICLKRDGGNHYVNECGNMNVSNIMFTLLLKYHEIEYEFIDGYYWGCPPSEHLKKPDLTGKKNIKNRKLIKELYTLRKKYKAKDSTVEQVIKMVLNTCYGKTIQKTHKDKIVYIDKEHLEAYCKKNGERIKDIVEDFTNKKAKIIEYKEISDEFTSSLIGIQILEMSKKIMNQAFKFCDKTALYQDTDSIQLRKTDADKMIKAYNEHYKKEMIGSELGQFSSDFGADCRCIRAIYCGKKAYYCNLLSKKYKNISYRKGSNENRIDINFNLKEDIFECHYEKKLSLKLSRFSNKFEIGKTYEVTFKLNNIDHIVKFDVVEEEDHHIRLKGVPGGVIRQYCIDNKLTPWELYMKLYNGEAITFNLASVKVCFKFDNLNVSTLKEFERMISFK